MEPMETIIDGLWHVRGADFPMPFSARLPLHSPVAPVIPPEPPEVVTGAPDVPGGSVVCVVDALFVYRSPHAPSARRKSVASRRTTDRIAGERSPRQPRGAAFSAHSSADGS